MIGFKARGLAVTLVAGIAVAGCSSVSTDSTAAAAKPSATQAATQQASAPAKAAATAKAPAKALATAKLTAGQAAAMNAWYSGATVTQAANVCGDVYRVYSDNVAINSGTGSSNLQGDITKLQTDIAAALSNPPPVARNAAIWERVLNAYSNAAGDPTNAGLVAAARSADRAAWRWAPSFGGTLLSCLNTNP
jgi:uncharacterized protein YceK